MTTEATPGNKRVNIVSEYIKMWDQPNKSHTISSSCSFNCKAGSYVSYNVDMSFIPSVSLELHCMGTINYLQCMTKIRH